MLIFKSKLRRNISLILLAVTVLSGCAGQQLHNNGMQLVQEGNVEEGLAKLEQATKAAPDNVSYRNDLIRSKEQITKRLLASASTEHASGRADAAQAIYDQVLKIDPNNRVAKTAIEAMAMDKRHDSMLVEAHGLFEKGDLDGARFALRPIFLENPKNGQAILLQRQIDEQETKIQMAEPTLKGQFKKPITLQFRDANLKMVFEALSRTSGINVLLDKDIRADIKTSIFVKDVSVEDAIDLLLMQNQLEKKVLSNNTVYIYPNTPSKTKDFQDLKIRSFHLVNADPKQILTLLKTMLKTKDIFIHEKTNSIVMRDTPDAIHLAEKLIADQDIAEPEVMLEVEVLEISRSRLSEIGIKYPQQLVLTPLQAGTTTTAAATAAQLTLNDLRGLNKSTIGINTPTLTLNAMLQDSDTNILSSPRLRVRNRDKAKIMIGERVPMITNSVTPVATGTPVVTGSVTYQDVGLTFDVEPEIHLDNEVSIKLGLEVSSLGLAVNNSSGSQVYRVGTRKTSTTLRLKDGETQILGGLITDEDRNTSDKVPLLGQIPILGHLFSSDGGNKSKTEIVLSITPHVVGNSKLPDAREMEYWSGTESELRSSQLVLKPLGVVTLGNSASAPSGVPVPRAMPAPAFPPVAPPPSAATTVAPQIAPTAIQPQASGMVRPPTPPTANTPPPSPVTSKPLAAKDQPSPVAYPMALSWQGPTHAKVGDKITLTLNTQSAEGVKSLGILVGFDPTSLKAIDALEGASMKRSGAPSSYKRNIDQAGGEISVDLSGTGASGSAAVITLTFEAIADVPESSVSINSITATGTNGEELSITAPGPHLFTVAPQ